MARGGARKAGRLAVKSAASPSKLKDLLAPLAVAVLLILVWWMAVVESETVIFPTPLQVVTATVDLVRDGTLWDHIGASLFRVGAGFLLAVVVGVPLGLLMGWIHGAFATLNPLVQILRPISPIAWIPLAILWFGVGFTSTVFVIFFSGIWSIMFNTMTGVQTLSGQYTDVAKVYLASRSLYTRRILIPGSLPYIITGMRLTYGVGWRVIVGAEMISSITGLGFLIDDARWQLRPDIMICGMITIAMIGWVSENWFFDWVEEKTLVRWGMRTA